MFGEHTITTQIPREIEFINNGPFEFEDLIEYTETVAGILEGVEEDRPENEIEKVAPEGEGHGILVEYRLYIADDHARALHEEGYTITSTDTGRAFVAPFDGTIDVPELYDEQE